VVVVALAEQQPDAIDQREQLPTLAAAKAFYGCDFWS
jgi:hypothetical protein